MGWLKVFSSIDGETENADPRLHLASVFYGQSASRKLDPRVHPIHPMIAREKPESRNFPQRLSNARITGVIPENRLSSDEFPGSQAPTKIRPERIASPHDLVTNAIIAATGSCQSGLRTPGFPRPPRAGELFPWPYNSRSIRLK